MKNLSKRWEYRLTTALLLAVVIPSICLLTTLPASGVNYTYTELVPPAQAYGINNSGAVVGYAGSGKSFIYSEGTYTELPPLGWNYLYAYDINDSGAVVGYGYNGSTTEGFIYSEGTYTELLPPGWEWADARGINNSGAVVGFGEDGCFIAIPLPVPEPSLMVLLGISVMSLVGLKRWWKE